MQEAPTVPETSADAEHHLKQADAAHNEALRGLGEVVVSKPAYIENGQVVSQREAAQELAHRQLHGQASQEAGTPR